MSAETRVSWSFMYVRAKISRACLSFFFFFNVFEPHKVQWKVTWSHLLYAHAAGKAPSPPGPASSSHSPLGPQPPGFHLPAGHGIM